MRVGTDYKWNLKLLLPSESGEVVEKVLSERAQQYHLFIDKWKNNPAYLENSAVLKEALDEFDALVSAGGPSGNAGYYFGLKEALNQSDSEVKAVSNKIEESSIKLVNEIQFFTHKLSKVSYEVQEHFLNSPELLDYRHFLELLFAQAKYLLSEPEERILNLKEQTSNSNWVRMVSDLVSREERLVLDSGGKKKKKTVTEIRDLLYNPDKKVRDTAAKAFNHILASNVDVAENELNSILLDKKIDDELRNIGRPDLSRHMSDDIDSQVVDAMLEAVVSAYHVSKRFYELKSRLYKVPKLAYHETNLQYGELNKKVYPFEEALSLVSDVFRRLAPEFEEILNDYLEKGKIDLFPKKGKSGSEFCIAGHLRQPGFVLLNYNSGLEDVTTLAHEMGHAINNELIRKSQNGINFDTPLCTAEVASTFMEDFVYERLEQDADDETRFSLMLRRFNDDTAVIFRQVACYKFEQELHSEFRRKGYLSKDEIGKLFLKHMGSYMGPFVEQNKGSENWWVHWSHIRTYFYVYSYASGQLISKALQAKVRAAPSFIKEVKKFLSTGTSKSPSEIFSELGIDISKKEFWVAGLGEVENLLNKTWEFAEKSGRI